MHQVATNSKHIADIYIYICYHVVLPSLATLHPKVDQDPNRHSFGCLKVTGSTPMWVNCTSSLT